MSVENPKNSINITKVGEWLGGRCGTLECPFCKNMHWEAINGPSHIGSAIPYGSGKGDMYTVGYQVLLLVCSRCNFVRPVALTPELLELALEDSGRAEG